jgi:hypothetical protein
MRKLFLSLVSLAAIVAATPAALAATPYRSAGYFDNVIVDNGKKLDVTGRVIAGTIKADVIRDQTWSDGGKPVFHVTNGVHHINALRHHCQVARFQAELPAMECHYSPTLDFSEFPTAIGQ